MNVELSGSFPSTLVDGERIVSPTRPHGIGTFFLGKAAVHITGEGPRMGSEQNRNPPVDTCGNVQRQVRR